MSIVDEESWNAVQSRLAKRRRSDEAALEASARLREWQNRRPVIRYAANESDQL